jgi:hypothetical protein
MGAANRSEINAMNDDEQHAPSQLFTVRVWQAEDADGRTEWRGKLRHIPSGEIRHFRGWAALIPLMLDLLRRHSSSAGTNPAPEDEHGA